MGGLAWAVLPSQVLISSLLIQLQRLSYSLLGLADTFNLHGHSIVAARICLLLAVRNFFAHYFWPFFSYCIVVSIFFSCNILL